MKNKISGLVLLLVLMNITSSFGQEVSKESIKIGFGPGMHMGRNTQGTGLVYTIGYQRELLNDRLRFNPNFSIGQYSSGLLPLDARDQYFNSTSLEANLYYDLLKLESFSIVIGVGALINHSRGLEGTVGDPEYYFEYPTSEYLSDYHFGGYFGGGFRINSLTQRTSINILPFNFHAGTHGFLEFIPKVEIDIKI